MPEKFKCFDVAVWDCPECFDRTPNGGRATKRYVRCKACGHRTYW